MRKSLIDMKQWCHLMGLDLRKSDLQPLQPIRINKNGAIKINVKTGDALGFSASDCVGVELRNGQCLLRKQEQGGVPFKAGKPLSLTVSEEIMKAISSPGADGHGSANINLTMACGITRNFREMTGVNPRFHRNPDLQRITLSLRCINSAY